MAAPKVHSPARYEARREAAKQLFDERKLSIHIIARLMRRHHTSILFMVFDEMRDRRNRRQLAHKTHRG